jgi:hypothetical protein
VSHRDQFRHHALGLHQDGSHGYYQIFLHGGTKVSGWKST